MGWAPPAQVKAFTAERSKIFFSTIRIGALDPGYSLAVIPAPDEVLNDFGNTIDPEAAVGFSILCIVDFSKPVKMFLEDRLEGIGPALRIGKRLGQVEIE